MSTTKYKWEDLLEEVVEETSIQCGNCGKKERKVVDSGYACEELFKEGWRVTKTKCYCPSCASKNLKQ